MNNHGYYTNGGRGLPQAYNAGGNMGPGNAGGFGYNGGFGGSGGQYAGGNTGNMGSGGGGANYGGAYGDNAGGFRGGGGANYGGGAGGAGYGSGAGGGGGGGGYGAGAGGGGRGLGGGGGAGSGGGNRGRERRNTPYARPGTAERRVELGIAPRNVPTPDNIYRMPDNNHWPTPFSNPLGPPPQHQPVAPQYTPALSIEQMSLAEAQQALAEAKLFLQTDQTRKELVSLSTQVEKVKAANRSAQGSSTVPGMIRAQNRSAIHDFGSDMDFDTPPIAVGTRAQSDNTQGAASSSAAIQTPAIGTEQPQQVVLTSKNQIKKAKQKKKAAAKEADAAKNAAAQEAADPGTETDTMVVDKLPTPHISTVKNPLSAKKAPALQIPPIPHFPPISIDNAENREIQKAELELYFESEAYLRIKVYTWGVITGPLPIAEIKAKRLSLSDPLTNLVGKFLFHNAVPPPRPGTLAYGQKPEYSHCVWCGKDHPIDISLGIHGDASVEEVLVRAFSFRTLPEPGDMMNISDARLLYDCLEPETRALLHWRDPSELFRSEQRVAVERAYGIPTEPSQFRRSIVAGEALRMSLVETANHLADELREARKESAALRAALRDALLSKEQAGGEAAKDATIQAVNEEPGDSTSTA